MKRGTRRVVRTFAVLAALAVLAVAGVAAKLYADLAAFRDTAFGSAEEKVVEIPTGSSARQVVRLLARAGVLADEQRAWRYVRFVKRDHRTMRAGEYAFAGPLRPDDVLERVYRGEVKTYRFTVAEGLRMDEVAAVIEAAGLGRATELLALMRNPAVAKELGLPFATLEGALYPDTYTFTRNPPARAVLAAMVARYREEWKRADAQRLPGVDLDERQAVTLASIIEKETGRPDERGRISCVFHNRLKRGMRLGTDPTVLYAKMLRQGGGAFPRNITRADLTTPHPYNTYTTVGLPPGPIANPGAEAMRAALRPDRCGDLYFVSRNDGSHVFCPDLACHEAAVRKWQVDYFRKPRKSAAAPRPAASR
ncbi:MAG TPA: endolytic transglycosylase MltG [Anaeromyxobacteraceae bacterium]|nr:endolytic transglycosylase MltG [Anaeromyxobacteraceae bacterium]